MNEQRIARVLDRLKELGLTQMLIVDPRSIYYLTDVSVAPFERFFGLYLNTNGKHVLFLNRLFTVPDNIPMRQVWFSDTDPVTDLLAEVIDPAAPLGVDKDLKARFLLPLMERHAAAGFVCSSYAVDITRAVKDEEERKKMRISSALNDQAMAQFKALIHEGITELEAANQMKQIYLDLGCEDFSFTPIVSFGANAADPHHEPDDTVLKPGDCVLFDVGGLKDGYCSDMTRTFYYKEVSSRCRMVHDLVRAANAAAEAVIRPGIPIAQIDAAARDLITEAGFGPNFNHRLGHFIGLDIHEYGDVSSANEWLAQPGMIFSVEPGIYLAGETGVRIEDLVLVTEDGCEILNHYPKELEIIE